MKITKPLHETLRAHELGVKFFEVKIMTEFRDAIITNTDCFFDWKDRVRILFRGIASVRVVTQTENLPGEVLSKSAVSVPRIFRFKKISGGYEAKFNQSFKTDGKKDAAA